MDKRYVAGESTAAGKRRPRKDYQVVGKSLPRIDAWRKATGQEEYTEDTKTSNALWGKILRSPHAHARIKKINTEKAAKLPGVKAVITFEDIPRWKLGHLAQSDKYALSPDKVRYIGDDVAAVAAVDEETAERALALIKVDYEVLPPIVDPVEAMKSGAPRIHEELKSNIASEIHSELGKPEKGFKDADHVFEDTFTTQRQCHVCMETHGCVASWDRDGRLSVWTSTQIPHIIKWMLAEAFELPFSKVQVNKVGVGGGFGGRTDIFPSDIIASSLSKRAGRPVKLILSREEEFASTVTRHPSIITIRTGIKNGKITTRHVKAIIDAGAYIMQSGAVLGSLGWKGANYYRIENYKYDGYAVYTNTAISSAYRTFGGVQLCFALESQIDMIAEKLGVDPVEFRLKNANMEGDITVGGCEFRSCGLAECIEKTAKSIGWGKKKRPSTGRGMAIAFMECGFRGFWGNTDVSSAIVKVNQDGTVHVLVGGAEIGTGYDTAMAQIAAETLGVRFENVSVHSGDTDVTPYDLGLDASRGTHFSGAAVKLAAEEPKRQLLESASELLGVPAEGLEARDQRIYAKKNPKKAVSISEAADHIYTDKGLAVIGKGVYDPDTNMPDKTSYIPPPGPCPAYLFGAIAIEVEVDRETGQTKITKLAAAHDCGKAVNPVAAEGQIEGDVHHGLGIATVESGLMYDETGIPSRQYFLDHKVLTSADMPPIDSILVETNDPIGPFGVKGVAQITNCDVPPALANALYDAVGVRIEALPITPEKVLEALKNKGSE